MVDRAFQHDETVAAEGQILAVVQRRGLIRPEPAVHGPGSLRLVQGAGSGGPVVGPVDLAVGLVGNHRRIGLAIDDIHDIRQGNHIERAERRALAGPAGLHRDQYPLPASRVPGKQRRAAIAGAAVGSHRTLLGRVGGARQRLQEPVGILGGAHRAAGQVGITARDAGAHAGPVPNPLHAGADPVEHREAGQVRIGAGGIASIGHGDGRHFGHDLVQAWGMEVLPSVVVAVDQGIAGVTAIAERDAGVAAVVLDADDVLRRNQGCDARGVGYPEIDHGRAVQDRVGRSGLVVQRDVPRARSEDPFVFREVSIGLVRQIRADHGGMQRSRRQQAHQDRQPVADRADGPTGRAMAARPVARIGSCPAGREGGDEVAAR
ncbi:hypothetical protein LMG7053_05308 [Achromobacter ruhlandii]|uniref:Uncharacterized protein n=1 Tax=Achromobacter ruhlandii TaxID=72557 RepID=A0ABM8M429_9BURK|nr:hypothetical protein LMG7053_05308 [Achromobacter ruhlandii]